MPTDSPRISIDPEMTLEQRISRLEELECLRLGIHQAHEDGAHDVVRDGQEKIGKIMQAIIKTVRARVSVRDLHRNISH